MECFFDSVTMEKFIAYILSFVILPLYITQGLFFEQGSIYSQGMVLLWLLIDVYYTFYFFYHHDKSSVATSLLFFWLAILLSWLISPQTVHTKGTYTLQTWGDMKNITLVILTYFPFRHWIKRNILSEKQLRLFALLMIISSVTAYFLNKKIITYGATDLLEVAEATNNMGYYFVMVIPFLALIKNQKFSVVLLFFMVYFTLSSAKRGAIVCMVPSVVAYFYYTIKRSKTISTTNILSVFIMFSVAVILAYDSYKENAYLQMRMEEMVYSNDTSGRDVIYSNIINAGLEGNLFQIIFGHGIDQAVAVAGNFAHNDWLELFIDHGILGLILYFTIFRSTFRYYVRNKYIIDYNERFLFLSMFICWGLKSFFSMGYTEYFSFIFLVEFAFFEKRVQEVKTYNLIQNK